MRKLVSVQSIRAVQDIPNADLIQAYQINGWWIVDKKGAYNTGDKVIYCEIDSWIPHTVAPFLSGNNPPKVFEGIEGARLRTKRLRGFYSQGLILPLSFAGGNDYEVDTDLTDILGFKKWEPVMDAQVAGMAEGMFPTDWLPKSDEDRIQNLVNKFAEWQQQGLQFVPSEKIEGSSLTVALRGEQFKVCSRNLSLKEDTDNAFWQAVHKYDLQTKMQAYGRNIAIRAELVGPGLNGNIYDHTKVDMLVYNIYDIDKHTYLSLDERMHLINQFGLRSVPVFED